MAEVRICDFCKKRKAKHNFHIEQKRIVDDARRDTHFSTYGHIDVCNKCYKTLLKEMKSDDDEKDNILVTNIKNDFRNEAAKFFTINENEEHIVVYETICEMFDKVIDKYFKS